MTMLIAIAEISVVLFAAILLAVQFACYEAGHWFGRRNRSQQELSLEAVSVVVGAMLALLAFVLALTLSFATARYSERQAGTLKEANAIGTAWLRAKAIGNHRGEEIASLLEDYTRLRADFVRADERQDTIDALDKRTAALQSQIWGHVSAIVRARPDAIANALMISLNEAFDAGTAQRFAFNLRLPPQIPWLLISLTFLSVACLGYNFARHNHRNRAIVVLLMVMWTAVIVNIFDLASARLGYLRIDTTAYEWTLQGFEGGVVIPPR